MKNNLFTTARVLATGLLLCLGSTVPSVATAGEKVAIASLPAPVVNVILYTYPNARIEEAEWEVDDGRGFYEIDLKVNDEDVELEVSPDGRILKRD